MTRDPRLPDLTYRKDRGSLVLPLITAAIGVVSIAAVLVMAGAWIS